MKTTYIYIALVVAIIAGLVLVRQYSDGPSSERITRYDSFGQCLKDAGAKFYGAFWCPHCQEQKEKLDKSLTLPYIECSTPNGQGQLQLCIDEKITGYPTWKFSDGSVIDKVMEPKELSEKTGCALPTAT